MRHILLAVALGVLVAVQTRTNGELGRRLDDGLVAATISFGSGFLLLAMLLAASSALRQALRRIKGALVTRAAPWWYFCGGAAGALVVLSQSVSTAAIGVSLFAVALVSGQTLSSLLMDKQGLGSMAATPLDRYRIAGSCAALLAVVVTSSSELQLGTPPFMIALPFVAGLALGWQQAVGGQVRDITQSAQAAAFVSAVGGTIVLLLALAIRSFFTSWPSHFPSEIWLYSGGLMGVVYLGTAAAIVHATGVLVLGLGIVAGQLFAALVLDLVVPPPEGDLTFATVLGTAIAFAAVGFVSIPAISAQVRRAAGGR